MSSSTSSIDSESIRDEIIERELKDTRKKLVEAGAPSRERSCAITKIDEACHWLAAGREERALKRLDLIKGIVDGKHDDRLR